MTVKIIQSGATGRTYVIVVREERPQQLEYCECGCGLQFPASELVTFQTGNDLFPTEKIHKSHLAQ